MTSFVQQVEQVLHLAKPIVFIFLVPPNKSFTSGHIWSFLLESFGMYFFVTISSRLTLILEG